LSPLFRVKTKGLGLQFEGEIKIALLKRLKLLGSSSILFEVLIIDPKKGVEEI
jgi:hypothetical protein